MIDDFLLFMAGSGVPENGARNPRMGTAVAADHDVFQNRHVGKQPNVLEGPGHTPFGHLVGFETVDPFVLAAFGFPDEDIP